jgi:poly-beta-1,6-N-acetyl-D-glucosamine synthase
MKRAKSSKAFQRGVGLLVVSVALLGIAAFWWALSASDDYLKYPVHSFSVIQNLPIFYSLQFPPAYAIIAALAVGAITVAAFVGLELRDVNISRRSHQLHLKPLAPWVLMNQTRGQFNGEVTVTVLVPAHNEQALLANTLESLQSQSRKPDRVIVVLDNCTDQTEAVALSAGVEIFKSVNNTNKKAGALNQALAKFLPELGPNDTIMVMDADTILRQGFLASAVKHFTYDRGLSAIGGLFYGEARKGFISQLQRNEYIRYSREIRRRRGRVFVLTGTASIFRAQALRFVSEHRGTAIPGNKGEVYDTGALTEDNELTIALKSLGALVTSPPECMVETELMPTYAALWRQRLRWQRGALENIAAYGITSTTTRYFSQQLGLAYSVFALWTFYLMIAVQLLASSVWVWYPFWVALAGLFIAEKVFTVRDGDWKAKLLAALLIPELLYDTFLDLVFLKGALDIAFKRQALWGHEVTDKKLAVGKP